MSNKKKIIRITTVPISLEKLLVGQLKFMNNFYEVKAVSSDLPNLLKYGKENNVEVFCVEMTREITPIRDVLAVMKLYRYLKKEKPFIVHTHTPKAGMVGMLAAKLANVPIRLHTVAGLPLLEKTGLIRKILNLVEKITYACATKVYPNSKVLRDVILQSNFCEDKKLKVLGNGSSNGIDTTYFNLENISIESREQLKIELGIQKEDIVFVFVGRLVRDKGINELIEAFEKISATQKQAKLLLVGEQESNLDPLKESILQAIANNRNIISVGFQADVRPYFAISTVLVFPSYREGFPNVVMQAGAMELPSVVTDINGCNEIILEGVNGLIIPVKNSEEIYQSMLKLIEDMSLRNKLRSNARQLIVERYEQKKVWKAILDEYTSLEEET